MKIHNYIPSSSLSNGDSRLRLPYPPEEFPEYENANHKNPASISAATTRVV